MKRARMKQTAYRTGQILLLGLGMLLAHTALATNYDFPNKLPAGCSNAGSGNYTCGSLSLNWNDTVTISSPKPASITFGGPLSISSNVQINTGGLASDLVMTVNGAAQFGYDDKITGNINAASVSDGGGSTYNGSITATNGVSFGWLDTINGNVNAASVSDGGFSTYNGSITATNGVSFGWLDTINGNVNAASVSDNGGSTYNGNITATNGVSFGWFDMITGNVVGASVSDGGDTRYGKSITATSGSITLNSGDRVDGDVTAQANHGGNITLGYNTPVSGCVQSSSNSSGSISLAWNASAGGVCCLSGGSCGTNCVSNGSGQPMPPACTPPSVGPDHIRITDDGNGLTCTPETLTVIACANAACTAPYYTASAVTGNVTWAGAPGGSVPFNITAGGTTTVSLPVTTVQTVTLGTSAVNPAAIHPSDCWNTATATASCSLPFADSGLLVSAPNHVAETVQNMTISAVRKADNALNCVPAFANVSRTVNLKCAYANPTTGTLSARVAGIALNAGNNATAACDATGQSPSLTFNASGTATTTLQYADVGQMTLNATYTGSTGTGDAGLVMTGSGSFIAAPASFAFSGITAGPIKAGNNFSATVTAANAADNATPNFGKENSPEGVTLTSTLVTPAGGHNPALGNGMIAGATFTNGIATLSNLNWSEVGNINLNAVLTSGNYLASGLNASGVTAATVGRFIPDHFDTAVLQTGVAPAFVPMACPSGLTCPTLYNGMVYSGQPFSVQVTARNLGGGATTNYDGLLGFSKAVTLTAWDALGSTTTQNPGGGAVANGAIAAAAFRAGIATTATPAYTFATAPTSPTDIYIRAADTDGVSSLRANPSTSVEGGIKVVSGRLQIANAYGSELLALPVNVSAQYWNGSAYVPNSLDSCTSIASTNFTQTPGPGAAITTTILGGGTLSSGAGAITLTKPAPAPSGKGSVNLASTIAWLPGSGRATFGIAASPFIYLRENY